MSERLYVGIDVGSSATKCIIVDDSAALVGHHVVSSGFDYCEASEDVLRRSLLQAEGEVGDIAACISTGYGREHVKLANKFVTEITCHARGAREWYPEVRNIVDVGGQDTKVIRLSDTGQMVDYRMNSKCAAGTGTFLESTAHKLGLTLAELDELAMASTESAVVNSYCTVFAGTEVIERIKAGQPREDISMGLFRSIATRVCEMIATRDGATAVTGGVATHCRALLRALEEVLETDIFLPPMPQHAGAYGAALLAKELQRSEKGVGASC
jgi:(R)-2-hydroxyacyl-CoA dehydratese activating ATPase